MGNVLSWKLDLYEGFPSFHLLDHLSNFTSDFPAAVSCNHIFTS